MKDSANTEQRRVKMKILMVLTSRDQLSNTGRIAAKNLLKVVAEEMEKAA